MSVLLPDGVGTVNISEVRSDISQITKIIVYHSLDDCFTGI